MCARFLGKAICVGSLVVLAQAVQAQPVAPLNCEVTLFKHIEVEKVRSEMLIFFLDQVTESNYKDMKTSIGALVPGYFAGEYEQFNQQRSEYRRKLNLTVDQKYSREYAVNTLTAAGLAAYQACLRSLRKETELVVFRQDTTSVDKRVTFVVDLDTRVALRGPLMVEVFGGGRLLSAPPAGASVRRERDALHISIADPIGANQFTVERPDRTVPFQVTAQMAGKVAPAREVGPHLEAVTKEVDADIAVRHTTYFLARRLGPGPDQYDFRWASDVANPDQGDVPKGTTFQGNACLCASGETTSWNSSFGEAGRCIPPKDPTTVRLLLETVRFHPEDHVKKEFPCGGQLQAPIRRQISTGSDGVCYTITLSLNAPSTGSTQCEVNWTIVGKVRRKTVTFEVR